MVSRKKKKADKVEQLVDQRTVTGDKDEGPMENRKCTPLVKRYKTMIY